MEQSVDASCADPHAKRIACSPPRASAREYCAFVSMDASSPATLFFFPLPRFFFPFFDVFFFGADARDAAKMSIADALDPTPLDSSPAPIVA